MQRISLLLIFLFTALFSSGQQPEPLLVKVTVKAERSSDQEAQIDFHLQIPTGWHLYAESEEEGLAGPAVQWPDETFSSSALQFQSIPKQNDDVVFEKPMQVFVGDVQFTTKVSYAEKMPSHFNLKLSYELGDAGNFIPEEQTIAIVLDSAAAEKSAVSQRLLIPAIQLDAPRADCRAGSSKALGEDNSGLGGIFLLGFLGGLLALLTPCVFPMIPLTVSFFTKSSGQKSKGVFHAFLYAFFILLIYVLLSLPFHFLDQINPDILNNISTNVYLNVLFFIIFVVFALSFFGLFEITLPSSITNKADSKSGVGTIVGIFFMALTLAIVSFSCTGPILGSLLAGSLSTNGGAMQLTMGMAGFGLALALPFGLFALFPGWLNAIPKSGGWLNTVKVVLGFLELALALKFLSNADLVMHWGLLKREVFIGIWIVIGIGLSLYLFGIIRFPHDSPVKKLSKLRLSLAVITALFTLYLVPGLTNTRYANLTLISGFPPPLSHSIYQQESDCLLGLNCTHDYEEGLVKARAENKPLLLDFTGYACVNCRRMEENVWSKPEVLQLMKDNFIVVSLYVDDKKKLPVEDRFTYTTRDGITREIETVGDKWATFETENFRNNAQPLYVILNTEEELMNHPADYTPDVEEYKAWLECGLKAFGEE